MLQLCLVGLYFFFSTRSNDRLTLLCLAKAELYGFNELLLNCRLLNFYQLKNQVAIQQANFKSWYIHVNYILTTKWSTKQPRHANHEALSPMPLLIFLRKKKLYNSNLNSAGFSFTINMKVKHARKAYNIQMDFMMKSLQK